MHKFHSENQFVSKLKKKKKKKKKLIHRGKQIILFNSFRVDPQNRLKIIRQKVHPFPLKCRLLIFNFFTTFVFTILAESAEDKVVIIFSFSPENRI